MQSTKSFCKIISYVCALAMASCATPTSKLDSASLTNFSKGETGVVIVSYAGPVNCLESVFSLRNINDNKKTRAKILAQYAHAFNARKNWDQIALIAVDPGSYKLEDGYCKQGDTTFLYKTINMWFEAFEVNSGEIVYPGSILAPSLSYKVDGILDFIPEFITSAATDDYQVYKIEDNSTSVKNTLQNEYPELTEKFKTRLLETRLDANIVEQILADAYAKDADGNYPDATVASRRTEIELAKYVITGEYKSSN